MTNQELHVVRDDCSYHCVCLAEKLNLPIHQFESMLDDLSIPFVEFFGQKIIHGCMFNKSVLKHGSIPDVPTDT